MNIGNAILLCRTRRQLSQGQLAKLAGCSTSYLSLLENGRRDPPLSTISKISQALKIPTNILIFLAASPSETNNISKELAGDLSRLALELLNEPVK